MVETWGNWTDAEKALLQCHYATGGSRACQVHGVKRTTEAIQRQASLMGIKRDTRMRQDERYYQPWPMPTQDVVEQLDCVRLRKWRGPTDTSRALAWRV